MEWYVVNYHPHMRIINVCFVVYGQYLIAGRGYITLPLMMIAMFLMQGSQIMNSYTLVWWESKYVLL